MAIRDTFQHPIATNKHVSSLAWQQTQHIYPSVVRDKTWARLLVSFNMPILSDCHLKLVTERLWVLLTQSTANNTKQVANLVCAQANSAYYSQWDRQWVVVPTMGWGEGLVQLTRVVVTFQATGGHIMCQSMPISCHFWKWKALLVMRRTHVSSTTDIM